MGLAASNILVLIHGLYATLRLVHLKSIFCWWLSGCVPVFEDSTGFSPSRFVHCSVKGLGPVAAMNIPPQ